MDIRHHGIPTKANRILNFILIGKILILIRIWHLTVLQYDQKLDEAQKPQRKTVIEPAIRATIRDRFNFPLAINRISYQATLLYSQLREIPSFEWQMDATGKRVKIFKRKEYIRRLSEMLAKELNLSSERIEDLIYSKATYYSSLVPFVIKEDLTEKEYYRLKILEKDWPGLHTRHLPKRIYPKGRLASDVIGYMGAINRQEYEKILHEMKALEQMIQEYEVLGEGGDTGFRSIQEARRRLKDLEARAYTIHDYVGKTGIEGVYEEQLRGAYGKKKFYTDSKGNFLRELPGSLPAISGHRVLLALSAELQEYAEQLLAQNEELRIVRKSNLGQIKQTVESKKQPWIKGGGIVVMDPNTAEIITLASYPRYNPNDFILLGNDHEKKEKKASMLKWMESDSYIAQIWNQQRPLERERYDIQKQVFYDEQRPLNWRAYLDFILPVDSPVRLAIDHIKTLSHAIQLQNQIHRLMRLLPDYDLYAILNVLYAGENHEPFRQNLKGIEKQKLLTQLQDHQETVQQIKQQIDPYLNPLMHNYDKVLLVDLCRLAVSDENFSPELLHRAGKESLDNYHYQMGCLVHLMSVMKEMAKEQFHQNDFKVWREREEKAFLKGKRQEEKIAKVYPKPYLDYLDQKEKQCFNEFWNQHCWDCLYAYLSGNENEFYFSADADLQRYLTFFHECFKNLEEGDHPELKRKTNSLQQALKGYPRELAILYLMTLRPFDSLNRPLLGYYRYLRSANAPLEKHLAAAFYPAYGFGYCRSYAYRQSAIQGSLFKLVTAYEALVQRFQKLGRKVISPQDLNPLIIVDKVHHQGNTCYVGYTEEGKSIPQLYKGGRLPRSLAHKENGRVDLLRAIEMSSNPYFALLAGECLSCPEDLSDAAKLFSYGSRTGIELPGEIAGNVPKDLSTNRTGLYAMAIGQHSLVVTPLQAAVMLSTIVNGGKVLIPKLVKLTVGQQASLSDEDICCLPEFPYKDSLSLVGIDFPLFSAVSHIDRNSLIKVVPTEIKRQIFMPEVIRQILLKGLRLVTQRTHQENLISLARLYRQFPEAIRHFTELKEQLLGKTSTSESVENMDLDIKEGTNIYTHVWFGSIVFDNRQGAKNNALLLLKDEFGQPEVVVVVYLRYGGYGKEAAPLAAQIAKKWREIKEKYSKEKI